VKGNVLPCENIFYADEILITYIMDVCYCIRCKFVQRKSITLFQSKSSEIISFVKFFAFWEDWGRYQLTPRNKTLSFNWKEERLAFSLKTFFDQRHSRLSFDDLSKIKIRFSSKLQEEKVSKIRK